jgi:hypothetical protein
MAEFWRDEDEEPQGTPQEPLTPDELHAASSPSQAHGSGCHCDQCTIWFDQPNPPSGRCKCGKTIDMHPKDAGGVVTGCPR